MEKRILTNSFAVRFGTAMHGIVFTDCFFSYRYFVDKDADFKKLASGKLSVACPAETVVGILFADEAADVGRLPSALPRFGITTSRTLGTLC